MFHHYINSGSGHNRQIWTYHMSMGVEYSVDPRRTSGGRYQRVTTSLEYVLVGTDLARAKPKSANFDIQKCQFLSSILTIRLLSLNRQTYF